MVKPGWIASTWRALAMRAGVALAICTFPQAWVYADTGLEVLNENALTVAQPDRVFLDTITRAGDRLVAAGEEGVIIYSDDNGETWRQAVVPVSVTITAVAFANKLAGWAAGDCGVVLHTDDGGVTWTRQVTGDAVNQLMLGAATQFSNADPTTDAAMRAVRRANIFVNAGPDKPFLSILPLDAAHVMVFGSYRMMLVSNNAGRTWADWSLHIGDPVSHNLYDVLDDGASIYLAGEVGTVLRSDDGGKSFNLLSAPSGSTLFGILDAGNGALVAYGVAGAFFRSTDKGNDWTAIPVATQANLTAGGNLASGETLVLAESGDVFASTDHGTSFHAVGGNQGMGLFGMAQAKNGDVVFVGDSGVRVVKQEVLQ